MLDDPFALDRRLREVARSWLAWRRALRQGGAAPDHRFEDVGAFASAELVHELREASERDPLAPALLRWTYRLHLEHATRELVASRERAFRLERHPLEAPAGTFTLSEMLAGALADTKGGRRGFLQALAKCGVAAGDFELRRWERRVELSQALGVGSPDALELPSGDVIARARKFLDETREPMAELDARDAASLVEVALGSDTVASWPSKLTVRSLAGLFDESKWLDGIALELEELPNSLGASSFLRGLSRFGAALRTALVPSSLPFATAHDPWDLPGATLGALFALVPLGESFARRKLGVARARLGDHRRVLLRTLLVAARTSALRVVLREPTLEGKAALRRAYPELGFDALGVELVPNAAAVLVRSRVSDPQRFAALLLALDDAKKLEEAHDEDWYRNPRATEEVRESSRCAAERKAPEEALERGARELTRLFTSNA